LRDPPYVSNIPCNWKPLHSKEYPLNIHDLFFLQFLNMCILDVQSLHLVFPSMLSSVPNCTQVCAKVTTMDKGSLSPYFFTSYLCTPDIPNYIKELWNDLPLFPLMRWEMVATFCNKPPSTPTHLGSVTTTILRGESYMSCICSGIYLHVSFQLI
jgi:hypothetical protein